MITRSWVRSHVVCMLCSWEGHFTLNLLLLTQVYKLDIGYARKVTGSLHKDWQPSLLQVSISPNNYWKVARYLWMHWRCPFQFVYFYHTLLSVWSPSCTFNRFGVLLLPVISARCSTSVVFPLPTGPSRSTGLPDETASARLCRLRCVESTGTRPMWDVWEEEFQILHF